MTRISKQRADQLLAEQGAAESREKAKRLIMAGLVTVETETGPVRVDKPGHAYPEDAVFHVGETERFVGRGAYKLLTALEKWNIPVQDAVCLDVGASTGGFTDCLLQHGAARVYAVDTGYGQLHPKLRNDPRVVCMERVNMRKAPPDLLSEPVDLVVVDVSFISLKLILPVCLPFMRSGAGLAALIKPQFEVGKGAAPKGVVKDESLRMQAVQGVLDFAEQELYLGVEGFVPAKIQGPKGNQEYMAYMMKH